MGWGKLVKSVTKPFKEVGKAINWKDWGGAALSTVGGGLVGLSVYGMASQASAQRKAQKAEQAAAEQAAQQQYDASVQPVATPEAVQQNAIEEETYQNNKKRRFSVARTTMPGASLLGGGAGRTTLG